MSTINTQADVERIMIERNVSFHFHPLLTEHPDGTWTARYPGADWTVTGSTEADTRAALRAEELRIIATPAATAWKINAVREHFENGPVPGVLVIDNAATERAVAAGTTFEPGTPEAVNADITALIQKRLGSQAAD